MLKRFLTTDEKGFYEALVYSYECHRNSLRKSLEHRLAKAKAQNNQALMKQLEAEDQELRLDH